MTKEYEKPKRLGHLSIEVLPFLKGRKWDEVAWAYVHSLRPSTIRVGLRGHAMEPDAIPWRVTVLVYDDGEIHEISQECVVGLYGKMGHGHDLSLLLKGEEIPDPDEIP